MEEEFLAHAATRAEESKGTAYEWDFKINRLNILIFAEGRLDEDWDDIIDEYEDLPFDD